MGPIECERGAMAVDIGSGRRRGPRNAAPDLIDRAYRRYRRLKPEYTLLIDRIHLHVVPRTYVEIGVATGRTLALVLPGTDAIGIDPDPRIKYPLSRKSRVFELTSDDFFAQKDLSSLLGHRPVDLAFIDGMHHFEFALRDFMNIERYASRSTAVLAHDCLPIDESQQHASVKRKSGPETSGSS